MVQALLEFSSHAVRNATIGKRPKILNVSDLPLNLRERIFDLFRLKHLMNDENVLRMFGEIGFFDGFTSIEVSGFENGCCAASQSESLRRNFLPFLVANFSANRYLAENVTLLKLTFPNVCREVRRRATNCCVLIRNIHKLLVLCKNVKRLELIAFKTDLFYTCDEHDFVAETDDDNSLRSLEQLSLIHPTNSWTACRIPQRWFDSISSLELDGFPCRDSAYVSILARCRETLTSLRVVHNINVDMMSAVPVKLPKLRWFTFTTRAFRSTIFEEIADNCPSLTTAKLNIPIQKVSESELIAIAELSGRLELHLRIGRDTRNFARLVEVAGESIAGLEFDHCDLTGNDYDLILSSCTNLIALAADGTTGKADMFLKRFFTDRAKASKLINLGLVNVSIESVLKPMFTNCNNLQRISLIIRDQTDLSDYLHTWVECGARPVSVSLVTCSGIEPKTCYSLLKAAGRNLKHIKMQLRITDDEDVIRCPKVVASYCPYIETCDLNCMRHLRLLNMPLLDSLERFMFNFDPFG